MKRLTTLTTLALLASLAACDAVPENGQTIGESAADRPRLPATEGAASALVQDEASADLDQGSGALDPEVIPPEAIRPPPPPGGERCVPRTQVWTDGGKVYFRGSTFCTLPLPYTLQITYGRSPLDGKNWPKKTCWHGSGQQSCGEQGIVRSVGNPSGKQEFCMVTHMMRPNASGKTDFLYSLPECHKL